MTASEASVPRYGQLPDEALEVLREALVAHARQDGGDDDLRHALTRFAAEARARTIPPETVLVQLKRVWHSIPLAEERNAPGKAAVALQRIVTMCIQEYFR